MKKSLITLAVAALFGLTSTFLVAEEAPSTATIVKLTGSVKVQLPGAAAAVVVNVGDKIPQGSIITTGPGAEVFVQPFEGTVSVVKENATVVVEKLSLSTQDGVVKKQSALLNLKAGNLVSIIDPAKRAINDYSVRTPVGVAAARGTEFAISVDGAAVNIASTSSSVTFSTGTNTYTITAGMVSINGAAGVPLASISSSNPGVARLIGQSVGAFATSLASNLQGLSADSATTLASQIAGVAAAAAPSQAATYNAQIVSAIASSSSFAGTNASNAIASVTAASASSAGSQYASAIAGQAAAAAPSQAGTIAASVAQAVPGSSDAVNQAVATATNQRLDTVAAAATAASGQTTQAVAQTAATVTATVTPVDTSVVSGSH